MFFVIPEMPSKTFVMVLKKLPDHFKFVLNKAVNYFGIVCWYYPLYQIVDKNVVHTYAINQVFRFFESIWLHRKSRQIRKESGKDRIFILRAQHVLSYHLILVPCTLHNQYGLKQGVFIFGKDLQIGRRTCAHTMKSKFQCRDVASLSRLLLGNDILFQRF